MKFQNKSRQILVIAHDPISKRLLEIIISATGHAVLHARDTANALEVAQSNQFDLVFLDVPTHDLDDMLQLCRQIKAIPDKATVPIIMLSESTDEQTREQCVVAGTQEFVPKPFSHAAILSLIHVYRYTDFELVPEF